MWTVCSPLENSDSILAPNCHEMNNGNAILQWGTALGKQVRNKGDHRNEGCKEYWLKGQKRRI